MTKKEEMLFQDRMARHIEELRWLYMELYHNESMFAELCQKLYEFASQTVGRGECIAEKVRIFELSPLP